MAFMKGLGNFAKEKKRTITKYVNHATAILRKNLFPKLFPFPLVYCVLEFV
ncbi:MAG: hypothetical protein UX57_C0024G0007 [Candidatus Uhrbacteria bacterium GW2011_GWE2_46_68]|uniref:Uncharacterized protein n=1 Tax=Candidatus Uhrbacteria bacterium GW2011_GWE2_46_68 TaxID=1618994 RepID=A0A0G1T401_9BACT|nr:MAG: hypothetical protein UX57_C0024G0007 [Candidatus Uhrbacteria bacterium GW2011_GWE2_46_68]